MATTSGNGHDQPLHECSFSCGASFTTASARMSHEPSCLRNPDRVDEAVNPEREL